MSGLEQACPLIVEIGSPGSRVRWSVLARFPLAVPVLVFSLGLGTLSLLTSSPLEVVRSNYHLPT